MDRVRVERDGPAPRRVDGDRTSAALVVHLVAASADLDAEEVHNPGRRTIRAARARQVAMYLAHTGLSWTLQRTGAAFGRDKSTVAHACQRVETLRDDLRFDARLSVLEQCLRALPLDGALL